MFNDTVDSVVSQFTKMVTKLEVLAGQHADKSDKCKKLAADHLTWAKHHKDESERALKFSENISNFLK